MEKELKPKAAEPSEDGKGRLTYEQLNDACNQLWQQNQSLVKRVRELEQFDMFKRLEYLFRVLDSSDKFPGDFVISCTDEIVEAMTIPKDGAEQAGKEG